MKKAILALFATLFLTLSSCGLVETIFNAGVWVGILIVAAVLFILIYIIVKLFR